MILLHPGDRFPTLAVPLSGGDTMSVPDALAGGFGVVLLYRGAWCPYCNAQLRAFQRASDNLAEVGAKVVALSVDDEATTAELVAKHGLKTLALAIDNNGDNTQPLLYIFINQAAASN